MDEEEDALPGAQVQRRVVEQGAGAPTVGGDIEIHLQRGGATIGRAAGRGAVQAGGGGLIPIHLPSVRAGRRSALEALDQAGRSGHGGNRRLSRPAGLGLIARRGRRLKRLGIGRRRYRGLGDPAVVEDVEHGQEFLGGLQVAGLRGVVIAVGVGGVERGILPRREGVLDIPAGKAVVAIRPGQDGVEIKDRHVGRRVVVLGQPVVDQPLVEGTRILGIGGVGDGRGGDDHEELIGPGGKILQDLVVDVLGVAHRVIAALAGRVIGAAIQVGVGEAGFEQDDLVLAAGVSEQTGVG